MLARTFSAGYEGIDGNLIEVEAANQRALPQIHITGLPGDVIKESRDRVRACLTHLGYDIPSSRIVVHLSPAETKKQGSQFDVAIAMSVLGAEGLIDPKRIDRMAFLGELNLSGEIQKLSSSIGLIQRLEEAREIDTVILPAANFEEARLLGARKTVLVRTMADVLDYVRGLKELAKGHEGPIAESVSNEERSLDRVLGQALAKRALEIALAGRHPLMLVGPPGVGKSLLAGCAPDLLTPLSSKEYIEVLKNYSHSSATPPPFPRRPFRSPHHSISSAALLGGGSGQVIPGEVTLSHQGVLFLDEFPEFRKDVIEGLREPLQSGEIHLHRIGKSLSLPARFTLIVAMNPCPCGHATSLIQRCQCAPEQVRAYQKRISGAIWDRLGLCVFLQPPRSLERKASGISHREIKEKIARAHAMQEARYDARGVGLRNGDLEDVLQAPGFELEQEESNWLEKRFGAGNLSYRRLFQALRVARTIADLERNDRISVSHLQEAWGFRCPNSLQKPLAA